MKLFKQEFLIKDFKKYSIYLSFVVVYAYFKCIIIERSMIHFLKQLRNALHLYKVPFCVFRN